MVHKHTVASFDEELGRLHDMIERMGRLAEGQLAAALKVMAERDAEAAAEIIKADAEIDRLEAQVESLAVRMLALRQPMASDLREIVAAFKISSNLERVGDFASSIAKRAVTLSTLPAIPPVQSFGWMGESVLGMLRDVVTAYRAKDAALALAVRNRDSEVDHAYTGLFRELLTYMMEDPRVITPCTHLLFMAKNLERVGDHATNIAENIWFQEHGEGPMPPREKRDESNTVA